MTTALEHAREIRHRFFPPNRPVTRLSREEINRQWALTVARRQAKRDKELEAKIADKPPPVPTTTWRRRQQVFEAPGPFPPELDIDDSKRQILLVAAIMYGVSIINLLGHKRLVYLMHARTYAIRRLRDECGMSFLKLGRLFDGRDHTSARNLYRRGEP